MDLMKKYYGNNYEKAMHNSRVAIHERKLSLVKKYPHATLSKFEFFTSGSQSGDVESVDVYFKNSSTVSTNITSTTFKNDKKMWIWLHNNKDLATVGPLETASGFPKIWSRGGTVQENQDRRHYKAGSAYKYDPKSTRYTYPEDKDVLNYNPWDFKVYVDSKNWFRSHLFPIGDAVVEKRSMADSWHDESSYYKMVFATYVASYLTGISREHLTPSDDVHPVITSLMQYTLYYTISVILVRLETEKMSDLNVEFGAEGIYGRMDLIPREKRLVNNYNPGFRVSDDSWLWAKGKISRQLNTLGDATEQVTGGDRSNNYKHSVREWMLVINKSPPVKDHYKLFILKRSNGFTPFGIKTINNAIASFCYSILGAQARLRTTIVGSQGISLQCQDVFRQLVKDTIVNHDITVGVNNMRKAISDCNQTVNLAASPSTFLLPSDMKILKKKIPGYNNVLFTANELGMKFGLNKNVNYTEQPNVPVKTHSDAPVAHLDNLDNKHENPKRDTNSNEHSGSSSERSGDDDIGSGPTPSSSGSSNDNTKTLALLAALTAGIAVSKLF